MKLAVPVGREFRLLVLMCALVFACAWGSTRLSNDAGGVSCIWITNGIISAFVLTVPPKWKAIFLVAGQSMSMGLDLMSGEPLAAACWYVGCNSAEVLITVIPLGHITCRAEITQQRMLCRIAYFGVFLGPLISALLGSPLIAITYGRPFHAVLRLWFLSASLGAAASLPSLLFFLTREKRVVQKVRKDAAGLIAFITLLIAVTASVFWQTRYPLAFLLFPPLIVIIFRFRLEGAVFGSSIVVILGATFTAEGYGPFRLIPSDPPELQVMLFHILGLILFATCIPVGYSIEERFRLARELNRANGDLSKLAFRDSLTGVLNRRSVDEVLEFAWADLTVRKGDLSLLYIDIDYFKRFNDTYGHQSGDDCLRRVATVLGTCVRKPDDCVARYGGEEFVIVLPDTPPEAAKAIAERIARAIPELNIPHTTSSFGIVTTSIGIATLCPGPDTTPSMLLDLADVALYAAKEAGRNRIEISGHTAPLECAPAEPVPTISRVA